MDMLLHITIVLITGFFALLLSTKILGKTQISQLTAFDFISAIVLGELVGNGIFDESVSVMSILYAVLVWTVLVYGILIVTQKFRKTRAFLEGNPSILIRNGVIDRDQLVRNKLDINELLQMLRTEKDIFSLREVEFAILEPNGKLSARRKYSYEIPTSSELHLAPRAVYLPITIISDGEIDRENLEETGQDEGWLRQELKRFGIASYAEVLYAEWQQDKGLFCLPLKEKKQL